MVVPKAERGINLSRIDGSIFSIFAARHLAGARRDAAAAPRAREKAAAKRLTRPLFSSQFNETLRRPVRFRPARACGHSGRSKPSL